MIKFKEFNDYYITVPKNYDLSKNLFLKDKKFLFARKEELKIFRSINKQAKCYLIDEIEKGTTIVLNNKIAYYQYILPLLPDGSKIYLYHFVDIDKLSNETILYKFSKNEYIFKTDNKPIFIPEEMSHSNRNNVLKKLLFEKKFFFLSMIENEFYIDCYYFRINRDTIKKNNVFLLIPSGGQINSIDFSLYRIASFLKKLNKKTVLVAFGDDNFIKTQYFDEIYLEKDLISFIERINNIEKELIIYRGWMHSYLLGGFLVNNFPNVVVNIKDWDFADKKEYEFCFGDDAENDFLGIELIFKKARKVLSHYTVEKTNEWAEKYSVNKNKFIFFPELCTKLDIPVPQDRDIKSVVWAGTIPPTSFPERHYISKDMYHTILKLTEKNIDVYFVLPPNYYDGIKMHRELYFDYLYQDQFNKYFHLVRGEDLNPDILRKFGYGMFPLYIGENRYNDLFEYAVPSKLAFYLEANLPIIVNKRMKAISKIVEDNNIGIVISNEDLHNFTEILYGNIANYYKMVENIIKFKYYFSYDELGIKCLREAECSLV